MPVNYLDNEIGIAGGGIINDPASGDTSVYANGPSGCITFEDQNDYNYGTINPNNGNVFFRSGDTLSGSFSIESVCAELFLNDGYVKDYQLTQPGDRELVSGYSRYSIIGNFNEIQLRLEDVIADLSDDFKAGSVSGSQFAGNPKTYTVLFGSIRQNNNYAVAINSPAKRTWSYNDKTVSGFTISANANQEFIDLVTWQIQEFGS